MYESPSRRKQLREERESPREVTAAPLPIVQEDESVPQRPSKVRRIFSAIGLACLLPKRDRDRPSRRSFRRAFSLDRPSRPEPASGPVLRAITVEDAQYVVNQDARDSDSCSVTSNTTANTSRPEPYVLFLGTERSGYKPDHLRPKYQPQNHDDVHLDELRPSLLEGRQLPVFFTPPPPELAAITPRPRSLLNPTVLRDEEPIGAFA